MSDCLFCKIAAGEIPSDCVWNDENVYAFRDIAPQAPVHILVIPKEHIESVSALDDSNSRAAARCLEVIAKLAASEPQLADGYRIISNVGENGGQSVKHLHFHLLGGVKLNEGMV